MRAIVNVRDQSKGVRVAIWLAIAIGAVSALSVVEKRLHEQTALRLRELAERWEIFS